MTYTQIIITIAAILGSGITGYWLGKWWSESCSIPLIAAKEKTIESYKSVLLMTRKSAEEKDEASTKLIISLNSLVNQYEECKKADEEVIEAYRQVLSGYIKLPDYSSVPGDIIPDKDIRVNTGNNQP